MNKTLFAALLLISSTAWAAGEKSIDGLWDATITVDGNKIPFQMGLSGNGANVRGWFFNGDDKEVSNSGKYENGALVLNFDSYAAVLKATVTGGQARRRLFFPGKG